MDPKFCFGLPFNFFAICFREKVYNPIRSPYFRIGSGRIHAFKSCIMEKVAINLFYFQTDLSIIYQVISGLIITPLLGIQKNLVTVYQWIKAEWSFWKWLLKLVNDINYFMVWNLTSACPLFILCHSDIVWILCASVKNWWYYQLRI